MKLLFWSAFVVALSVFGCLPFEGTDIAALEPAQLLYVYSSGGVITVETEKGWSGTGGTVEEAIRQLEQTAPASVFLQTVDYLLPEKGSVWTIPQFYPFLRAGCLLCFVEGRPKMDMAERYLRSHRPEVTLQDFREGERSLPKLYMQEGSGEANG